MSSPLEIAREFLVSEVAPIANRMDADPEVLRFGINGLFDRGLMALRRPDAYGGPAVAESEFRAFQELVARYSGALAFLQTQHQSAGSMIAKSKNESLKARYLPCMADGKKRLGIGFSQLRRPGAPMVTATPVDGGYSLRGHVPWVTGWTFYDEFLIGATLTNGEAVFGVIPFTSGPGMTISPPMELAAMQSAQTVTADLDGVFLSEDDVAFIHPPRWIHANDMLNIALQAHFALGCAQAGLDIFHRGMSKKPTSVGVLTDAYENLVGELDSCRSRLAVIQERPDSVTDAEKLDVRTQAIELSVRCAHAAIAVTGGSANSNHHPAQRVLREALVFTVSAQTAPIMEATVRRLTFRTHF
ncbi:MAG TPA: acyl-CoA dehydrogenase family protein [Fimbriimonadaceae bacterium]|nr:acyl-CoA dehydrogenase family protein [Fimbriimonadaceae bacterium]